MEPIVSIEPIDPIVPIEPLEAIEAIKKSINTLHEQINFAENIVTKLCWCHIVGKIVLI